MDYSKSGGVRPGSNKPRFDGHKSAPKGKDAHGGKSSKAELIARMKAAAKARTQD
ncbi:hypothetical protein [Salipiger mucosus]|nr:hypothetical protein [Salipiger mucosus]